MRKRVITEAKDAKTVDAGAWLNLEELAEVEITSEEIDHPIESALLPGEGGGWRAATPGRQTIRLLLTPPQRLRKIFLVFIETSAQRTQEYVLRWSADGGQSFKDIVRQQWNFNPDNSTSETEEHLVDLSEVDMLELIITPDIGDKHAVASLAKLRIA
jgi:hypothetical protein